MSHENLGTLVLERAGIPSPSTTAESAVRGVKFARRDDGPVLHLGELAIIVRNEFRLADRMSDIEILGSLQGVMAAQTRRARWMALFTSELGGVISRQQRDLNTAMGFILAQMPTRQS